jgi:hypothetical protein
MAVRVGDLLHSRPRKSTRLLLDGKHQRPKLVLRRSIPILRTPLSTLRLQPHDGVGVARYTFTATDLHCLPSAGLPAHPSTASGTDILRTSAGFSFAPLSRRQSMPSASCQQRSWTCTSVWIALSPHGTLGRGGVRPCYLSSRLSSLWLPLSSPRPT